MLPIAEQRTTMTSVAVLFPIAPALLFFSYSRTLERLHDFRTESFNQKILGRRNLQLTNLHIDRRESSLNARFTSTQILYVTAT